MFGWLQNLGRILVQAGFPQVICAKQESKFKFSNWKPFALTIAPPYTATLWWTNKVLILFASSLHGSIHLFNEFYTLQQCLMAHRKADTQGFKNS